MLTPGTGSSNSSKSVSLLGSGGALSEFISSEIEWYPRHKIDIARRKLSCGNPVAIMSSELDENKAVSRLIGKIKAVLQEPDSIRWRDPKYRETCADAAMQVEFLIDMATDYDILGRQWDGLNMWC